MGSFRALALLALSRAEGNAVGDATHLPSPGVGAWESDTFQRRPRETAHVPRTGPGHSKGSPTGVPEGHALYSGTSTPELSPRTFSLWPPASNLWDGSTSMSYASSLASCPCVSGVRPRRGRAAPPATSRAGGWENDTFDDNNRGPTGAHRFGPLAHVVLPVDFRPLNLV
jgi:hypothetical protein